MENKPKFKKGDLIHLNDLGLTVIGDKTTIGIVISDPYYKWWPPEADETVNLQFWAYDVQFGDEKVEMMPEDFIIRMINDKKDKM